MFSEPVQVLLSILNKKKQNNKNKNSTILSSDYFQ